MCTTRAPRPIHALVFLIALFAPLALLAQEKTPTSSGSPPPHGTRIPVRLKSGLNTATAKVGDPVEFQVDKTVEYGGSALKRGTHLKGRVTAVQSFTPEHPEARLALVVEVAERKGQRTQLHAFLCAVPPQPDRVVWADGGTIPAGNMERTDNGAVVPQPSAPQSPGTMSKTGILVRGQDLSYLTLRPSADPALGSELVSSLQDIVMWEGTALVVKQWLPN